jgi:hypothetical protein
MKLSAIHSDHIEAFDGLEESLSEIHGRDTAVDLVARAKALAKMIVEFALDDADPGRLTHSIDCVRAALEGLNAADDIGFAKRRRIQKETPVAPPVD